MKFYVVAVGKIRQAPLRAVADEYFSRIRRYAACDELEVKSDGAIRQALPAAATHVALEVDGRAVSSRRLAELIEQWAQRGKGSIAFIIGGAEGIPVAVSRECDERLSLSSLTLPHRLARVILAEQLYRAMTILRGEPYARE